jgi:hypothetical protein
MTRSLMALAASVLLAACSGSPESASRSPLCDPATDDCAPASGGSRTPSSGSPKSDVAQSSDPPAPVQAHQAIADAGADAAADAATTTFCIDLATCCGELKGEGYDNSFCKSVAQQKDEAECKTLLASHQDFGDCSK